MWRRDWREPEEGEETSVEVVEAVLVTDDESQAQGGAGEAED